MSITVERPTAIGLGNDTATSFSFSPTVIYSTDDVRAFLRTAAGEETELVNGTDFTVTPVSDTFPCTGDIEYNPGAPLATGDLILMFIDPAELQPNDLESQGGYFADAEEERVDRLTMMVQAVRWLVDRCVGRAVTSQETGSLTLPEPDEGKALGWASGALANIDAGGIGPKGDKGDKGDPGASGAGTGDMLAAQNLSDLADATTARTNLGVEIGTDVEAWSAILDAIAGLGAAANKIIKFTGASTAALLDFSVDTALGTSDTTISSQKAIKAYVDAAVAAATGVPPGSVIFRGSANTPTGYLPADGAAVSRSTYAALYAEIGTTHGAGNGSTTFNVPMVPGRVIVGAGTGGASVTLTGRSGTTLQMSSKPAWLKTGQPIVLTHSGLTGVTSGNTYYVIDDTGTNSIHLAFSKANAIAGTAISIGGTFSSGSMAQTLTARTLGALGGEESHGSTITELPAHTHTFTANIGSNKNDAGDGAVIGHDSSGTTSSTGGSAPVADNNMQPYIVLNAFIKT